MKLKRLFRRRRTDDELAREIDSYIEIETAENIARGITPDEARFAAHRKFGSSRRVREEVHRMNSLNLIETVAQDIRYGLRMLRKSPGFTTVAVLTLALGIGANTAVFTVFNAVALRPLQVPHAEQMANVYRSSGANRPDPFFSYSDYVFYRDNNNVFAGLAAVSGIRMTMAGAAPLGVNPTGESSILGGFQLPQFVASGGAEPLATVQSVSENYFDVLGVHAVVGRTFAASDNRGVGSDPFVLLSYNFWERRFNCDRNLIGKTLRLNGFPMTVIGITPRDFAGTAPGVPNAWVPAMMQSQLAPDHDWLRDENMAGLRLYARLKAGVSKEQAAANLTALRHQLRKAHPSGEDANGTHFVLTRGSNSDPPGPDEMAMIVFGLAAVGMVVLIACANVGGLVLARAIGRRREVAVRLALGASRGRLVRQLLTENLLVGLAAGATGLFLSYWLVRLILLRVSETLPLALASVLGPHISPDFRIFGYTLLLSCVATFAFGLAPALKCTKPDLGSALKNNRATFEMPLGRFRFKFSLRNLLLGVQVALCLVLLVVAGLLAKGSRRALSADYGFNAKGLVVVTINVQPGPGYGPVRKAEIERQLVVRFAALRGVQSVAVGSSAPLFNSGEIPFSTDLREPPDEEHSPKLNYGAVSPSYFETVGIPVLRGRNFTEQEARTHAPVVIVSAATARLLWPGQEPLGKQLAYGDPHVQPHSLDLGSPVSSASTVIGVAKDISGVAPDRVDDSFLYLPLNPAADWGDFLIRTAADSGSIMSAIPRELQTVDNNLTGLAIDEVWAIKFSRSFVMALFGAILAASVGLLGLLFVTAGLYVAVTYLVTSRTHEIGVRIALGAEAWDVLRHMLQEGLRPVAFGMVVGLILATAVSHVIRSYLFGLSPVDSATFLGVGSFLCIVALLAGYIPARRAMRVDPMVALRYE